MDEQEWLTSDDPQAMLQWLTARAEDIDDRGQVTREPVSDRKLRLWCQALCDLSTFGYTADSVEEWESIVGLAHLWVNPQQDNPGDPPMAVRAALLREIIGNPFLHVWRGSRWVSGPMDKAKSVFLDDAWLTPTVLSLAEAAYEERGRVCERCHEKVRGVMLDPEHVGSDGHRRNCFSCHGTGRVDDGILDPVRLAVLADALEEAGIGDAGACPRCKGEGVLRQEHPWGDTWATEWLTCHACEGACRVPHVLIAHLRSPGPHVRGCWAVNLLLGKE